MYTHEIEIFGINLTVNEIAFTIGGWSVYWYGVIIGIGCLLALIYGMKNASRFNLDRDRMLDVVIVTIPVAILCARLYYLIFDSTTVYSQSFIKEFFGIGTGKGFAGLAIYGGVIGAFVCGALMCKIRKVKILDMFDLAAIGFLIGQGIGRWGNFINQEAYGTVTGSSWWGMTSDVTRLDPKIYQLGGGLVHPCFLYESIWCIIGFFILNHFSKKRKFSGQLFLMYGVWYGFGRFFIESIRTDQLTFGKIPISMLVSAVAFISCLILLIYLLKKATIKAQALPYEAMFGEQIDQEEADETQETEELTTFLKEENSNGTDN